MHIAINGHAVPTPDAATVSDLLDQLKLTGQRIAVEVNGEIVTRSLHAQTPLKDGDKIEIVHAIGGG